MELDTKIWILIKSIKEKVSAFIIDKTVIQIGNQHFWLWICIELIHSSVLGIYISEARNMLVAERFIRSLVSKYGKHTVYTDGGTWYPEACNVLRLKHYVYSSFEKSLIERVINQYFKDRTESFDDYYPCMQNGCITNTTTNKPPSPSLPTNLSDQTIGNKGDNDVSILLGNDDGSFTSTVSDVVVGDVPPLCSRTL